MRHSNLTLSVSRLFLVLFFALGLSACAGTSDYPEAPKVAGSPPLYLVGPGDSLSIFVWRNPELSQTAIVRPDGRVSVPLIEDLVAAGKSTTDLAREIEKVLSKYIQNPIVTVMIEGFSGTYEQTVRIVGEAGEPKSLLYRNNMSVLDVMISVGGLTKFAAGNSTVIVRKTDKGQEKFNVRLDDLLKDGDISANAALLPGDILIIPQSWF